MRLDGRLDEPFWARADSADDFRQREPTAGAPPAERTVVRAVRDRGALYVGVRLYQAPATLRATVLRRDADLEPDDYVQVLIDGLHDRRSAFVFATNPNGAMWDGQVTGLTLSADWDGVWDVAVARDAAGWTAEFRIPFRTLRFPATPDATFGFNVRRRVRGTNEEDLWRAWGRDEGLLDLVAAGELADLGALRRRRDVALRPYALAQAAEPAHDTLERAVAPAALLGKAGLDAKIAVAATLTADVTVNTDFAQVEADSQVVNLTRFPVFFPEKREFFLESGGVFTFGNPGRAQLFYTRRVGLDSGGAPVPILAGARLYGRAGAWTVSVLDAATGGDDRAEDAVVRVKRDLFARSYVGALATLRARPGATPERALGADLDLPLLVHGHTLEPAFWVAATDNGDSLGRRVGWRASVDWPNDRFDGFASLHHIAAGFDPALGFVRRAGIRESTGHLHFRPRPALPGVRQLDFGFPLPDWDVIARESGSLTRSADWETAQLDWRPLGVIFQSGAQLDVDVSRLMDAPTTPFAPGAGLVIPAGRYWWTRTRIAWAGSPARPLAFDATASWGGFYDGRDTELDLGATWRGGGRLVAGVGVSHSAIHLPAGRFAAVAASGQADWAFGTRADLLAFVQYNNQLERADVDLRFHWIPVTGDDFYVVWTSGYTTAPAAPYAFPGVRALTRPLGGALAVKMVHRIVP